MAILLAVITDDARLYWPQFFGRLLGVSATTTSSGYWNPLLRSFKVGEGGWVNPGSGAVARTPDSTLRRLASPTIQDIDAIVDGTRSVMDQRYASNRRGYYSKNLENSDFTQESTSTVRIRCFLDNAEFNDNGSALAPQIWEIGIFADHPTNIGQQLMVAYGTFPMQTKNSSKQLENIVRLVF